MHSFSHSGLALLLLAASGLLAAQTSGLSDATVSDETRVTPEFEQKVRRFLDKFVDAGKTPEQQAALFTDDAEYYDHGIVGKSAIVRDVKRYSRHWPHRHYRVAEISYIRPDPASDRVFVAYTIDFEVANKARTVAGKASYGAVISDVDGDPKVEAIKERVTRRKTDPTDSPLSSR